MFHISVYMTIWSDMCTLWPKRYSIQWFVVPYLSSYDHMMWRVRAEKEYIRHFLWTLFAHFKWHTWNSKLIGLSVCYKCTTRHDTTRHDTTLHYTTLHYTTLHYTALHCTALRDATRTVWLCSPLIKQFTDIVPHIRMLNHDICTHALSVECGKGFLWVAVRKELHGH